MMGIEATDVVYVTEREIEVVLMDIAQVIVQEVGTALVEKVNFWLIIGSTSCDYRRESSVIWI